jgi:glutathione S-transferase
MRAQVPVLIDTNAPPEPATAHGLPDEPPGAAHCAEGLVVRDSAAVLTYLALVYGGGAASPWLPGAASPARAARAQQWLAYAASEVHASLLKVRVSILFGWDIAPLTIDAALDASRRVLAHLDAQLAAGAVAGRTWLVEGAQPTVADVAVYPYVAFAEDSSKGALRLGEYPALTRWLAAFRALPGYVAPPGLE